MGCNRYENLIDFNKGLEENASPGTKIDPGL